jgi:hypothetical protein
MEAARTAGVKGMKRILMALCVIGMGIVFSACPGLFGKDEKAPSVSITSPTAGSQVSGVVLVQASATDDVGVYKVVFMVDGTPIYEDKSAPYEAYWNTATYAAGTHYLKAEAYDPTGNVGESASVAVTKADGLASFAEDFTGYPLGATGDLSGNMPSGATWSGMTNGTGSQLEIVNDPAGGARSPSLRLVHGAGEDDAVTTFAPVPGAAEGEAEVAFYVQSGGALCISLGDGPMATARTAFLLWFVERPAGTVASYFVDSDTVQFGTTAVSKNVWHVLRIVFDCDAGEWGAYLDGNVFITAQSIVGGSFDQIEYLSISTTSLSADHFGGSFVVDDLSVEAQQVLIPQAGSSPSVAGPATLTATAETGGIRLTWTDSSDNEDAFWIIRCPNNLFATGTYAVVGTALQGATSYLDTSAVAGSTYYYRVAAYAEIDTEDYFGFSPIAGPVSMPSVPVPEDGIYLAGSFKDPADPYSSAVIWHADGVTVERIDLTDGLASNAAAKDVFIGADAVYACGYVCQNASTV